MMNIDRPVTLEDVAAAAGVSAITVSRVIRLPNKVAPATRDRVNAAIAALGYVPDRAASALASGRSAVVGLLVPSLTNNVFAPVLRGIYDVAGSSPYLIQIGNFRYSPSQEETLIRAMLAQKPAGMIVAGIDQSPTAQQMLAAAPCPVVQMMEVTADPIDVAIGFDQAVAGAAAADHLLEQGYRRPGFLSARMDPRSQRRMAGFAERLTQAGCHDARRFMTTPHPSSIQMGAQLLSDLLSVAPDTDAVFCNNDDLAAGAAFEAQRRHLAVPDRLGICGFNDHELSAQMNPPLSSVATPLEAIGRNAMAEMLTRLAAPGPRPAPRCVDLGFRLIARRSTDRGNHAA